MKKLAADSARCTGCGVCELVCSKALHKEENREKSAICVSANEQGGYVIEVCDQCGDCMNMCSRLALQRMNNGMVRLDKKSCVGCLICVGECARGLMRYHDELPVPFKCVACGLCVKACPVGALKIVEG